MKLLHSVLSLLLFICIPSCGDFGAYDSPPSHSPYYRDSDNDSEASYSPSSTYSPQMSSRAKVTVTWRQDGDDVIASWDGTLDLGDGFEIALGGGHFTKKEHQGLTGAGPNTLLYWGKHYSLTDSFNTKAVATGLKTVEGRSLNAFGSFGFTDSSVMFSAIHLIRDRDGYVTKLSFNGARDVMRFPNQTLAGMGADSFGGTVALVVNGSGDKIIYNTANN